MDKPVTFAPVCPGSGTPVDPPYDAICPECGQQGMDKHGDRWEIAAHSPAIAAYVEEDGIRTYSSLGGPTFQIPAEDAEKIAARPLPPGEGETILSHLRRTLWEEKTADEVVSDLNEIVSSMLEGPTTLLYFWSWEGRYWTRRAESNRRRANRRRSVKRARRAAEVTP